MLQGKDFEPVVMLFPFVVVFLIVSLDLCSTLQ